MKGKNIEKITIDGLELVGEVNYRTLVQASKLCRGDYSKPTKVYGRISEDELYNTTFIYDDREMELASDAIKCLTVYK